MAYLGSTVDDERLAKDRADAAAAQAKAASGGVTTTGAPGGGAGGAAEGGARPIAASSFSQAHNQAPGTAGSGLFMPLQNYLTANATQAGQMGQSLAGNIAASGAAAAKEPAGYEGRGGDVNKAASEVGASSSQGGRQALMNQYYGRPGYTQGQSAMDAFLVGGGGMGPIADVQAQYGGIQNAVGGGGSYYHPPGKPLPPPPEPGNPDEPAPIPGRGVPPDQKKPPKRGPKGGVNYGIL
jgi:hypothetical protein